MLHAGRTAPLAVTLCLSAVLATACSSTDPSTVTSSTTSGEGTSSQPATGPDTNEALRSVVEAEDVVIYALGITGAHLPRSTHTRTQHAIERHRLRRALWADVLAERGQEASSPAAAYALPGPVGTAQDARTVRAHALSELAKAYVELARSDDAGIAAKAAIYARSRN